MNKKIVISYLLCVLTTLILVTGCDSGAPSSDIDASHDIGAIQFHLALKLNPDRAAAARRAAASTDICIDYLVDTVEIEVYRSFDDSVAKSQAWDCNLHGGTIRNVPSGLAIYTVAKGYTDGVVQWQGQVPEFTVEAGQVKDIGTIEMAYVGADQQPPQPVSVFPPEDSAEVDLQATIMINFQEPLATSSVTDDTVRLTLDDVPVSGRIGYKSGTTIITFIPTDPLQPNSIFTVSCSPTIMDTAGIQLGQPLSWQFTSRGPMDIVAPQVIATIPDADATNVGLGSGIEIFFSEPIDDASVDNTIIAVSSNQGAVSGDISYISEKRALRFMPASNLSPATLYNVVLDPRVRDLAGNFMQSPKTWQFRSWTNQFNLSIAMSGGGGGTVVSSPIGVNCGTTCSGWFDEGTQITLTATPDDGSLFQGWTGGGCQGMGPCSFEVSHDLEISASFSQIRHTISTQISSGGAISPTGIVRVVHQDAQAFEIVPDQGYYLRELIVDGQPMAPSTTYTFSNVTADHTIQANFQAVRYVDSGVGTSGGGRSWETALGSLQEAINQADPGDYIWVKEGRYILSSPILIDRSLVIYGGFSGVETSPAQRDWQNHASIIDGNNATGLLRVTADNTRLDGIQMINGHSDKGAGVNATGETYLTNCSISQCSADIGGGVYSTKDLTIENCELSDNWAVWSSGGGIYFEGLLSVTDSLLKDNSATEKGGAIFAANSDLLQISRTHFNSNQALDGAGVYNDGGVTAVVQDSTFLSNSSNSFGGGIYNRNSAVSISGCLFENNNSLSGGGIYSDLDTSFFMSGIYVVNSWFVNNQGISGGGMYLNAGPSEIVNSIFNGNTADTGAGGIHVNQSARDVKMINLTVVGNTSDQNAGGIVAIQGNNLYNCVLWGNVNAQGLPMPQQVAGNMSLISCDIDQDGYEGNNGNIRELPMFENESQNDFHLQSASKCINAGANDAPGLPQTDIDGDDRIIDTTVDIGADEFRP